MYGNAIRNFLKSFKNRWLANFDRQKNRAFGHVTCRVPDVKHFVCSVNLSRQTLDVQSGDPVS
jgi:hypothetical protein